MVNIPARYVSGYIYAKDGLVGSGATHAWVEIFIPNIGWYGIDPTNNCPVGIYHIETEEDYEVVHFFSKLSQLTFVKLVSFEKKENLLTKSNFKINKIE